MKYIVTGGCGFIGSNAVDFLIDQGHEVVVIDNLSSDVHDTFYFNENAKYYKYSVTDYVMCSDVFKKHKPDIILHFAAEARIQNCIDDPAKAFDINTGGTITMLDLCKKYSIKKLILSSTSAIYGNKNLEQIENMHPDCLNPYSLSKFHAEQYCQLYGMMYGVQSVCLRYFNVYGPRNPTKGQYSPVIGVFQRQKLNNEKLTIVGDGEQTRDFIHVRDIVKANYIISNSDKIFYGDVFNVGTSKNYSINMIAEAIQNNKSFHAYVPQRSMECRDTKANIEKIKYTFGWESEIDLMNYLQNG